MKTLLKCLLFSLAAWSSYAAVKHSDPDFSDEKKVTIIQIVEHPALDATRQGILDTLKSHAVSVSFQSAQGSSSLATQIAQHFAGTKPDAMVGIGTTAAQALVAANHSSVPVIFSSVSDPLGAKLVQNISKPEGMVTGVSNFIDPALQFSFFKKCLPNLKQLGIIYNPGEANSVALVERMKTAAKDADLELVLAPANHSAEVVAATQQLVSKVQAIFINSDNTALSAFDSIVKISRKHNIPVLSSDADMVSQGALAAVGANQYDIGRQTGLILLQVLAGTSPKQIPVVFPDKTEVLINLNNAAQLNLQIPQALIDELPATAFYHPPKR